MTDLLDQAAQALLGCCPKELEQLLAAADVEEHYGLPLSIVALAQAQLEVTQLLAASPQQAVVLLEDALLPAQEALLEQHPHAEHLAVKPNAHVRLHSPPWALPGGPPSPLNPGAISSLGAAHIGRLVTLSGTVARAGPVKMRETHRLFTCSRCHHRFVAKLDAEGAGLGGGSGQGGGASGVQLPDDCPNPSGTCPGSKFIPVTDCPIFTNHQEVKVQERMAVLEMGALPASIAVTLCDEMADTCQPGDDVEVTGIVGARWRPLFPGARCDGELVLTATHTRVTSSLTRAGPQAVAGDVEDLVRGFWAAHEQCPLLGRNKILASICPQVAGLFLVKLAVALTLVGGVARLGEGGAHIRGEVHCLLVGDPGTGKSQVMKFAARMAPRSVVTTGRGTTGAGLTVTAIKEAGQWSLEAGALVLADGGLCCIDEFDGIRESDRAAMHEAMEQQTLHVAKAGLVTTLSTRTSVLGVCNPKARWNPSAPLTASVSISAPLLSRFDLMLMLVDTREPRWDAIVSAAVLAAHQQGQVGGSQEPAPEGWPVDVLRQYVAWARSNTALTMGPQAEAVLLAYYQLQRRQEDRSAARTTIRMLESLARLAQAHARLLARRAVTRQDAAVAVLLVDCSMGPASLLGCSNALDPACNDFPADPDAQYAAQERAVLAGLGLLELMEQVEDA